MKVSIDQLVIKTKHFNLVGQKRSHLKAENGKIDISSESIPGIFNSL